MSADATAPTPTPAPVPCPACGAGSRGRFCPRCGTLARAAPCGLCSAELAPGDRYCGDCGTPVGAAGGVHESRVPLRADEWRPSTGWKIGVGALAAVLAIALYMRFSAERPAPATSGALVGAAGSDGAGGRPSAGVLSMTPQQQADALYDRVMRLSSEGKRDSVEFFAPMAIGVYEQLRPLDLDQRFDLGTIALAAGMYPFARAQADTILAEDPDHLLGLALLSRTARASGASGDAARADARFSRIVETEVRNAPTKLEYERHKGDIEVEVRRLAGQAP